MLDEVEMGSAVVSYISLMRYLRHQHGHQSVLSWICGLVKDVGPVTLKQKCNDLSGCSGTRSGETEGHETT